ncbi:hypothetical protein GLUCORHAEAF1_00920 [Komagataeibacter rhaeticus AF1]|nr:hypothetical protein GLUCORHAEAF1_00920 [Komagataeibacter rhaeticus AF1]
METGHFILLRLKKEFEHFLSKLAKVIIIYVFYIILNLCLVLVLYQQPMLKIIQHIIVCVIFNILLSTFYLFLMHVHYLLVNILTMIFLRKLS